MYHRYQWIDDPHQAYFTFSGGNKPSRRVREHSAGRSNILAIEGGLLASREVRGNIIGDRVTRGLCPVEDSKTGGGQSSYRRSALRRTAGDKKATSGDHEPDERFRRHASH